MLDTLLSIKNGNSTLRTKHELLAENATLRQELAALREQNADLELLLTTTTEHSDAVEDALYAQTLAAAQESERRLRLILQATPVPLVISRVADGVIVYANATAGPLVGLSGEALLTHKVTDFYCNPNVQQQLLADLAQTGEVDHHEVEFCTPDGAALWVDVSLRALEFNREPCLLSAWHDITHLKRMNQAANRFVPQEYLGFFKKESIIDLKLGDYVRGEMTMMFSDLRSYTTISETMKPQENFNFINGYFGRVCPVIRQHQGVIMQYTGDCIYAIFPNSPEDAVQAGIAKLQQVTAYNEQRRRKGRLPIHIGIGVNTGEIMVGIVGEQDRIQGDTPSDEVNLTSRLEGLTKYYQISMIISAATFSRLADPDRYSIRFLDRVQVKGKQKPVDLYEVYAADPPMIRRRKRETQETYEEALRFYYARDFQAAQSRLFDVLQQNPRDKVAWRHLVKVTQLVETGVADNWTGVTVMTEK
jgi:PAS domain S-box-containing protein